MSPMNWDTAEELLSRDTLERLKVGDKRQSAFWLDHYADLDDPEYREAFEAASKILGKLQGWRYTRVLDLLEESE